jgi:hypothetical protein
MVAGQVHAGMYTDCVKSSANANANTNTVSPIALCTAITHNIALMLSTTPPPLTFSAAPKTSDTSKTPETVRSVPG